MSDDEDVLAEQIEHYRHRAPIYDTWWQRTGRYETGADDKRQWFSEVAQVEADLERFGATGSVLELAGGTGWWTQRLARTARTLTVIDSSSEAIELNRRRVGRVDVRYLEADLFKWVPDKPESFDVVFFSFWLSHVPRHRFEDFWSFVADCLAHDGRVFLIDNRRSTGERGDPYVTEYRQDLHVRRLDDGLAHRVVKVCYEPQELTEKLQHLGWDAHMTGTARFLFGHARRTRTTSSAGGNPSSLLDR